jgi:hypothetical protein
MVYKGGVPSGEVVVVFLSYVEIMVEIIFQVMCFHFLFDDVSRIIVLGLFF